MINFPHWRPELVLSCGLTGAIICFSIYWMKYRKSSNGKRNNSKSTTTPDLLNPRWLKVGKIKELYYYPLKSGRGKKVTECKFTEFGVSVSNDNQLTLRDRMFLAYKEESGKFITGRDHPKMVLVNVNAVDKGTVRLEVVGMESLDFELPQNSKEKIIDCSMWFDDPLKCVDCGDGPAEWISMFLTGRKSGLRIGVTTYKRRNIFEGPWEKFTKVYTTLRNDDIGLFADIASYMLMTESSLNELNYKLENSVTSLQFRPNIVVSGTDPFIEDKWEWIKIGKKVMIRNVKPCPRCTMIRIDPETGTIDDEPLKALRKFREQVDPEKISVDGKAPVLGIYCGLYAVGNVAVGDDVFVQELY